MTAEFPGDSGRGPALVLVILTATSFAGCSNDKPNEDPLIQALPDIAAIGSAESHLANTQSGGVVMSWLEPDGDGVALRWSQLEGENWTEVRTIASGANWFVNWADFPSLVPIDNNLWAAHWLVKRPGGAFAYDVTISTSRDAGNTWSEPVSPHEDGTPTEHGFVSLFPWLGGVGALWLDGRNMGPSDSGHGHGGMTLRTAVIEQDLALNNKTVVDDLVCDCCQTDVSIASSGPVAIYRNRSDSEIRDIYVARFVDGHWQNGEPLANDGWEIAGCPVNGPAIDAIEDNVAAAWFTAANGDSKVHFARSTNGGASFSGPVDIAIDRPIGRVDVVLMPDGSAFVSWLNSTAGSAGEIRIRHVSTAGELGLENVVASTDAGRLSGFPQMVRRGDDLVISWTDISEGVTQVRAAIVPVDVVDNH